MGSPAHASACSPDWRPASTCCAILLASALSSIPQLERAALAVEPGTTQLLSAQWTCVYSKDKNGAPVAKDCVQITDDRGYAAERPAPSPPSPPAPTPSPPPETAR